ncbi:MAG TPA: 23S rRNA (pseudouridine(1915)-N(3))-methyltransferase RlmH [Kofleriaceae bacterium]|nr:23S rRNA (pseudouridine(1915)-N(3))-methyltransferase RlmH [Kofleriaceae bacterium]
MLAVGRMKEDYFRAAEAEYTRRLRPYCRLTVEELKDEQALLRAVPDGALVVALDSTGDLVTSEELSARLLGREELHGGGRTIAFAIGGPDGHTDALRRRAGRTIAFGRVTMPHRLVRVVLLEQLYRAFTILRGHPYHH